jgi:RNA polymerase sigma factor (sigma-70 family)
VSDKELWDAIKSGDREAFSSLYYKYIQLLYNYGLKLTADQALLKDVLQELFTEFWFRRSTLSDVEKINLYLIKSLRFKLISAIRKNASPNTISLDDLLKLIQVPQSEDDELSSERIERMKIELTSLPERQREILHLKYFQNFTNEQISEIVNINYQSVSNLLYRALSSLRKKVD